MADSKTLTLDEIEEGYYKWCINTVTDALRVERILGLGKAPELKPSEFHEALTQLFKDKMMELIPEMHSEMVGGKIAKYRAQGFNQCRQSLRKSISEVTLDD